LYPWILGRQRPLPLDRRRLQATARSRQRSPKSAGGGTPLAAPDLVLHRAVNAMSTTSVAADSVREHLGIDQHPRRLMRPGPWMFGILVVVGAVAAAWWWNGTGEPVAAAYVTQNVVRGDLRVTVTATGTLTPINQVDVGSELSGIVKSVAVDYNDRVRAGQILARLDTTKLQAQASQIRAALDAARARGQQAQATLEEAQAHFTRAEQLAASQLLPESDLDTARATLR